MSIFEQIIREHREVEGMLQELSRGYDRPVAKKLRIYFTTHMSAEEKTLYSALGDRGQELAKRAEKEHNDIRGLLTKIGMGDVNEFPTKLAKLAKAIEEHITAEEQEALPRAQEVLDHDKIDTLSYQFNEVARRMRESLL